MTRDPHGGAPVAAAGTPLADARAVVILLHGRWGSAADILALGEHLGLDGAAYLAPQAAGASWYPYSFLAPAAQNEPWLASALELVGALVEKAGAPERTVLAGFSQGACLALEFAARHARRYGAVIGLSGGLIGPPGTPRAYGGTFGGTPCFLGCSDVDPHIPFSAWRRRRRSWMHGCLPCITGSWRTWARM